MEGTAAAYTYGGPYWNGDCYSDAQIEADAETYQDYLAEFGTIDPGEHVKKMPYVVNDGTNDAYIRIRVIIPAELDELLDDSYYTGTAVENKEFTYEKKSDGTNNIYEFTRIEPLASGEMTFFNVWGSIAMDKDVTNEDIAAAMEAGLISEDGTFSILVEADGIQSASFDSAADAWAAFDAESAA